jgi:predicted membrane protein
MRNLYGGIALVTIGGLLLLDNLGYADMGDLISDYWPLLLIAFGASILARHNAEDRARSYAGAQAADLVHASNLFGDVNVRSCSQEFKGGSVSTFLGDARVDLSAVRMAEGPHELRIHTVFGSSTVLVPAGTAYSVTANATFGTLSLPGVQKGGFASRAHVASPSFGTTHGRITIMVDHVVGDVRVEEVAPAGVDAPAA